jgi:polyhydroxyalkanoate synthesis regulator phasin
MADRTIITPSSGTTGSSYGTAVPLSTGSSGSGHSYVDWAAIIAGAVVASAIGVVFAGFGAALGLSALSPQEGEGSGTLSLILTGLWALITILASYGVGGYIAGRMRRRFEGATPDEVSARDSIHGMVVWGLGVLIGAWIAGNVIGTAANAVGNVAQGAAQAVGSVVQGVGAAAGGAAQAAGEATTGGEGGESGLDLSGFNPIEAINNRLLRGTGEQIDPNAQVSPVARDVIFEVARTGELTDDNRTILAEEIARNSTLSEQEANARIDQAVEQVTQVREEAAQRVEQAEQAARNAADAARRAAVLTGFLVAAGFAIALAAAMYGAGLGGRHRDEGRLLGVFRSY